MDVTFTIPPAAAAELIDAVADKFGWDPSSGVTKPAFFKQQTAKWWKSLLKDKRAAVASATANADDLVVT